LRPLYKRLLGGLIGLLLVAGCSNKEIVSDTFESGSDHPYYFDGMGTPFIAAGEEGYYFLSGNYIYYADRATMKPVLLENKPNSTCFSDDIEQESQNCNAFVNLGDLQGFLAYGQGNLYTIEQKIELEKGKGIFKRYNFVRISKDGSVKKTILTIDDRPTTMIVHRGYLYYATKGFSQQSEGSYSLMRFPLDRSFAKPETLYEGSQQNGSIVYLTAYGNRLYFQDGGMNILREMTFDLRSKTASRILSDDDTVYPFLKSFSGDKLLFTYFYGDIEDPEAWKAHTANLDGSQIAELPFQPDFFSIFNMDDRYFYVRPDDVYLNVDPYKEKYKHIINEMKVYDTQYRLVDSIPLPFKALTNNHIVGDESYMFFYYDNGQTIEFSYLDKQDIGSGNATFQPLISTRKLTNGTVVSNQ